MGESWVDGKGGCGSGQERPSQEDGGEISLRVSGNSAYLSRGVSFILYSKYFKLVSLELYVMILKIINIFKIKVPKIVRYMDTSKNSIERIKFSFLLTNFFK